MANIESEMVGYEEALASVAELEIEVVGKARGDDPENANLELMARTAVIVDAMETTVGALFGRTREQVHEDIGHLDPMIIQNAMQKIALLHAEEALS